LNNLSSLPQDLQDLINKHKDRYIDVLRSEKNQEYGGEKTDRIFNKLESILEIRDPERQAEEMKKFIGNRLNILMKKTKPDQATICTFSRKQNDFILPETEIKRHIMVDSFHINDPEIYDILIKYFKQLYEKQDNKEFKNIMLKAIIYAIGEYFGNYYSTQYTEGANRKFYYDHTDDIDLAEFKRKNIAVCAEKATVTHNFLKFFGIESHLIISTACQIGDSKEAHVYIVFPTEKGKFIFDPTNCVLIEDREGNVKNIMPAVYKISDEEYKHIIHNDRNQVVVEHRDQMFDDGKYTQMETQKRIYT
jgi:hypothetical protein